VSRNMNKSNILKTILLIIISFSLLSFLTGCDSYQVITFDNQTSFPIQAAVLSVPLDYQGTPQFEYVQNDFIQTGEYKKYMTSVQKSKSMGSRRKYPCQAINDKNEVIFFNTFTWNELHDMGWKVVIIQQTSESSNNITLNK
jgi:hypothetical protein